MIFKKLFILYFLISNLGMTNIFATENKVEIDRSPLYQLASCQIVENEDHYKVLYDIGDKLEIFVSLIDSDIKDMQLKTSLKTSEVTYHYLLRGLKIYKKETEFLLSGDWQTNKGKRSLGAKFSPSDDEFDLFIKVDAGEQLEMIDIVIFKKFRCKRMISLD